MKNSENITHLEDHTRYNRFYALIVEECDDFLFLIDFQGYFQYLNPKMLETLQYSPEEIFNKHYKHFIHPDDAQIVRFHFQKFVQGLPTKELQIRFKKKNELVVPVIIHAKKFDDSATNFSGISCSGRLPTKALLNFQNQYENLPIEKKILANIPALVWTCDRDLKSIYISPTSNQIVGFTPDEILKNPFFWHEHIHPEDLPKMLEAWNALFQKQETYDVEYRFRKKDNSWIWVNDKAFGFYEFQGEWFVDGFIVDISEVKQMQQILTQNQKMEALGRFAGGIAHDFNNLLTVIQGYSEMLMLTSEDMDRKNIQEFANEIQEATTRASNLTKKIMMFSRKAIRNKTTLNLNTWINQAKHFHKSILGEEHEILYDLDENLWNIEFDPSQIEQIFLNLLWNAKDAMKKSGRVTIQTHNEKITNPIISFNGEIKFGDYVILTLKDSGQGISKNLLPNIFEPFFSTKSDGVGLGLAIIFGIIEQNRAYIQTESQKDKGTTFTIYIPRTKDSTPIELSEKSSESQESTSSNQSEKKHILIVDDRADIRKLWQNGLLNFQYHVSSASNGKEALLMIKKAIENQQNIDYVISDVVMPEMDGITMAYQISELYPEIKIILITGYPHKYLEEEKSIPTGWRLLAKPIKIQELIDELQKIE